MESFTHKGQGEGFKVLRAVYTETLASKDAKKFRNILSDVPIVYMVTAFWGLEDAKISNPPREWKSQIRSGAASPTERQIRKRRSEHAYSLTSSRRVELLTSHGKQTCRIISLPWTFRLRWLL